MNQNPNKPEKQIAPVVDSTQVSGIKKKSFMKRMKETFIAEDVGDVGDYILHNVLIPAIKRGIVESVNNGISRLLLGGSSNVYSSNSTYGQGSYISYNSISNVVRSNSQEMRARSIYDYQNWSFKTYEAADKVLHDMIELIDIYKCVSISEYYQLIGKSTTSADNNYGWTNLFTTDILPDGDGWYINFPKPVDIRHYH